MGVQSPGKHIVEPGDAKHGGQLPPVDHAHAVLPLHIAAAGEVYQVLRGAVAAAARVGIVVGEAHSGDVFNVSPEGRRVAEVPEGSRHHHRVRRPELPGQGIHRGIEITGLGQGVPLIQHFCVKWLQSQQGLRRYLFDPGAGVGCLKGGEKGVCQGAGAGACPPLADAAVYKQQLHAYLLSSVKALNVGVTPA